MPVVSITTEGINTNGFSYPEYLYNLSRYIVVDVKIVDHQARTVDTRHGCSADQNIFSWHICLREGFPNNFTKITFKAPWERYLSRNSRWPASRADTIETHELTGSQAPNLLSHLQDLLIIAARYFVIKAALDGSQVANHYYLLEGLNQLMTHNRDSFVNPRAFYGPINDHLARFDGHRPASRLVPQPATAEPEQEDE